MSFDLLTHQGLSDRAIQLGSTAIVITLNCGLSLDKGTISISTSGGRTKITGSLCATSGSGSVSLFWSRLVDGPNPRRRPS